MLRALWGLEVLIHIHTIVEDSDYSDPGFRTSPVKDDMTALTELFVSWLYIIRIAANFRFASEQLESIIELLEVFIALSLSPLFGGEAAYIDNVFSGGGGEQILTHQ